MRIRYLLVVASTCLLALPAAHAADCGTTAPTPGLQRLYSDGWGLGAGNLRLQSRTVVNAANVARLELAWAYGLASNKPRSWPLVTEDTIFIGDTGRGIVALDRANGCQRWLHEHPGEIASALLPAQIDGRAALLFTDRSDGVYALDALTGAPIWHSRIVEEPVPMYSGTPIIHGERVFVPISSLEIGLTANPFYGCCTTSGGVAAFALATGEPLWYHRIIEGPAQPTERHFLFVQEYGPSGAPVWGAPTVDAQRGLVYVGTGQNYSHPTTGTSDAIIALDAASGSVRWVRQFTAGDAYNISCDLSRTHPNCPQPMGPDVDFGAPPVLVSLADGDVLIAGQKSGDVHALVPDTGEVIWTTRIGRGGALGGIHWGLAADPGRGVVYVPVSDVAAHPSPGEPAPGLYALDVATGAILWKHARASRCEERVCAGGLSAAIMATPELVVAGSLDGYVEAYAADSGEVLWSVDTWQEFATVNGVPARGGAIDAHGPMLAYDMLIVNSGYDTFGHKPGNALLVYRLPQELTGD